MSEENSINLYKNRLLAELSPISDWNGASGVVSTVVDRICRDAQTADLTLDETLRVLRRHLGDFDAVAEQAKRNCDQVTPATGQSIADVVKNLVDGYEKPTPWPAPTAVVRQFVESVADSTERVGLTTEEWVIVLRRRLGELVQAIVTVRVVVDKTPAGES